MKKYNFGAGPSILPQEVMKATADACVEFQGMGLSLMEISHRTKEFQAVMDEAQALFKELLNIPEGYSVLFLGGGASLEFCMVPYNLLNKKAAYLNTGVWAKKALKEAKLFGEVVEVASSADANYTFIPKGYTIPADADYFHITTNNTIYGTELHEDLDSPVPLVADMSSDIFSRPVDVSKYGLINGGVEAMQKRAKERAEVLYSEIDRNKLFRATVTAKEDRSYMNICFVMADEYKELEADFLKFATERGMSGIKGHRSVGGFRASCYNAMPLEGVKALVACMQEFEAQH